MGGAETVRCVPLAQATRLPPYLFPPLLSMCRSSPWVALKPCVACRWAPSLSRTCGAGLQPPPSYLSWWVGAQ